MSVPTAQVESARRADIFDTALRFTKLKKVAKNEYAGPCPVCGGRDRFSVNTEEQVWNCRGCDKGGDVIALVRHALDATFGDAIFDLAGDDGRRPVKPRPPEPAIRDDKPSNKDRALSIWKSAQPIRGTLAETYLTHRKVDLDQIPDLDEVLRFALRCKCDDKYLPCLVSLVRDIRTDEPKAIERVALTPGWTKQNRPALAGSDQGWRDQALAE